MPNETIAAVPANVAEPVTLKRFLDRLIEKLDIVLGFRGDDGYITSNDLEAGLNPTLDTIAEIASAIQLLQRELASLEESSEDLTTTVSDNTEAISTINTELASTSLGSTYYDFDNSAYSTLVGNAEFSTLGSNITNAPYTPVPAETYYNFINSVVTANSGVVQTLRVYSTTTLAPTTYFRIGDDWTTAVTLGWT
jgi:hypothetical protein